MREPDEFPASEMAGAAADETTTVDDVDVDLTGEEAPPGDLLSPEETSAIEEAVQEFNRNSARSAGDQAALDPSEVN